MIPAIDGKVLLTLFDNGNVRLTIKNEQTKEITSVELKPEQASALRTALPPSE